MLRILTDYVKFSPTTDSFAILATFFYWRFNFHKILLESPNNSPTLIIVGSNLNQNLVSGNNPNAIDA